MKLSKLCVICASIIFVLLAVALMLGEGFGTLSGFGWGKISALCPLGAFEGMIADKILIPRGVVSIVAMTLLIVIVGRAFCAYMCPVSFLKKIRDFFSSPKARKERNKKKLEALQAISVHEINEWKSGIHCAGCSVCAQKRKRPVLDSRHYILGGALLSTAIFGFPVFCLICPIGLSFATVLLIWRAFSAGDPTIGMVIAPLILIIEIIFLRKWCIHFCPLSAYMSFVGRLSKTCLPVVDDSKCIETAKGHACSTCALVCDEGIDLRHLEYGEFGLENCTRCHACVDHCPTGAISMPFIYKQKDSDSSYVLLAQEASKES